MSDNNDELTTTIRTMAAGSGPSVVSIGTNARGTGFVLATGKIVTNAHNLRDRTVSVRFADGRTTQAEVAGSHTDGDVVVLAVDTADAPPLAWATAAVQLGDLVFGVARRHDGVAITSGRVSSVGSGFNGPRGRRIGGGIEHTTPLRRGSSGGPLLDGSGRVVGINTHRLDAGFYLARAADQDLRDLLGRLAEGESVRRRQIGVAVADGSVTNRLRGAVGLPKIDGLLVRQVTANGPAAQAGIVVGDVLVTAGGAPLSSPGVLLDAFDRAGEKIAMHVVRGVDELDVEITLQPEGE